MRVIKPLKSITFGLLTVLSLSGFAQPKQSWLKKTWHNMNARFNGLYLSEVRLNESVRSLQDNHPDDFEQILDVFPYGTAEQRAAQKANLEEIYKQCSNVIKRHPKSKWVDEAWFLIGQSYFFQNEVYTALETYQYVARQYPKGEKKFDSKLAILKALILQEKYYDAEAIMSIMRKEGEIPGRLQKEFDAIAAEIYIKQQKYIQGKAALASALERTRVRDEKSRYHFILAQVNYALGDFEAAKQHYVSTIKLNPRYELAFQSNLGLVKTIGQSADKSLKTPRKYLSKMLKDDKNIDYYDQIYFELANLERQAGNIDLAIGYYQKSAETSTKNQNQKANSFLALATIYFNQKNFENSQKYFDSTALFISETHPDYERIKAQQLVLTDLIDNLIAIYTQDSLLMLAELPREELDARIEKQMAYEKEQEELRKRQEELNQPLIDEDIFNTPNKVAANANIGGMWYFYNPSAVSRGKTDFKRKWGTRQLSDVWRYKSMQASLVKGDEDEGDDRNDDDIDDNESEDDNTDVTEGVEPDKKKYYKNIPFSKEAKAASKERIADGLFNAGKLYYENLKEYDIAIPYLKRYTEEFPEHINEAEALFLLSKAYTALEDQSNAERFAKLLHEKHEGSPFDLVLNNREKAEELGGSNQKVSELYQRAYNAYYGGDIPKAKQAILEARKDFPGNNLQAKFDYLRALITGVEEGEEAYIAELQKIVELYPGTAIANKADYTIALLKEKNEANAETEDEVSSEYNFDPSEMHYFLIVYDGGSKADVEAGFSDYNKKNHNLENLRLGSYLLGNKNVLIVQEFADKKTAETYYVEFIKEDKYLKSLGIRGYELFTISKSNFRTLLMDKNADAYSMFFIRNYIQ